MLRLQVKREKKKKGRDRLQLRAEELQQRGVGLSKVPRYVPLCEGKKGPGSSLSPGVVVARSLLAYWLAWLVDQRTEATSDYAKEGTTRNTRDRKPMASRTV